MTLTRGVAQDKTQRTAVVEKDIREYPDVKVSNPSSPPKYYVPAKYRKGDK